MKVVYTGIESSGKSLQLAKKARSLVVRNAKWFKKTGVPRPIRSNMMFSEEFFEWAKSKNVPIYYWHNLDEIIYETECDVIMDEVLKYFDATQWINITMDAKHWLSQGAKTGVHVYASAQDFSQVAKSFRLLCSEVWVVEKIIGSRRPMLTAPKPWGVWGLCVMRSVDPTSFKGDNATMDDISLFPHFFTIKKEDVNVFFTNQKIVPSNLPVLRKRKQEIEYLDRGEVVKRSEHFV